MTSPASPTPQPETSEYSRPLTELGVPFPTTYEGALEYMSLALVRMFQEIPGLGARVKEFMAANASEEAMGLEVRDRA